MIKLKDSRQLEFYENHFYKKGSDIINCPEYLKKNTLSLFTKCYKCVFCCRKITLRRANAKSISVKE